MNSMSMTSDGRVPMRKHAEWFLAGSIPATASGHLRKKGGSGLGRITFSEMTSNLKERR